MEQKNWITKTEAASRAGVLVRTVDNWLKDGKITRYKDGIGRVKIDADELEDLLTPKPVAVPSADL